MIHRLSINPTNPVGITTFIMNVGPKGDTGSDGPSNITTGTTTDLVGLLEGAGGNVTARSMSPGGSGFSDSGKVPNFDATGGIYFTQFVSVIDGTYPAVQKITLVSNGNSQGLLAHQDALTASVDFPVLSASRSMLFPDADGVLAIAQTGVWSQGDQEFIQLKEGGIIRGALGALDDGTIYLIKSDDTGNYDPSDGGVAAKAGAIELHGGRINAPSLSHDGSVERVVYVDKDGNVYGVDAPAPSWSISDSDDGIYNLGTVADALDWVPITGLVAPITDLESNSVGQRVDISIILGLRNVTEKETGSVEVAFGKNGADPTSSGIQISMAGNSKGSYPISLSTVNLALESGDTLTAHARVVSGSKTTFGVVVDGSLNDPDPEDMHEMLISGGGSGQSSDTLKLGWANYGDDTWVQTTNEFDVPINSYTQLLIDGVSAQTDETQLPVGVSTFWANNTFTPVSNLDTYNLRVSFDCQDGATAAAFDIVLDIGSDPVTDRIPIVAETKQILKGASDVTTVLFGFNVFTKSTFLANGGKFYIKTEDSGDTLKLWDPSIFIQKTHNGR